jgi:very-short-patch-repair endonuclease
LVQSVVQEGDTYMRVVSEATRKKLSRASKRSWTPERRAKASAMFSGRHISKVTRQKMSEAWTPERRANAPKHNRATRKKMSESAKASWVKRQGFKFSEASRKRLSDAIRKRCSAPGYVHPLTGYHPSQRTRKLLAAATTKRNKECGHPMLGKKHSAETRRKMSFAQQKWIKDKGITNRLHAYAARERKTPSPPEALLWKQFKREKIRCQFQQIVGDRYVVDFLLLDFNTVVECDGVRHRRPKGRKQDQVRDRFIQQQGFRVIRVSNEEVVKDAKAAVASILRRLK